MSQKSKKSLYAFLLKTALKKDTSQPNKYPQATLREVQVHVQSASALRTPRYYRNSLLRTKFRSRIYRSLIENVSWYYGLSLFQT